MRVLARRARFCAATLLCMLLLLYTGPAEARPRLEGRPGSIYMPMLIGGPAAPAAAIERAVVDLTNQERRRHGCMADLTISPRLSEAAADHSRDMATNNLFSHTGSDGSTMVDRIKRVNNQYVMLAENIAAGYPTPQDVVNGWMDSPGHRANILNCDLRDIGIGFYDQLDDQANVRNDNGSIGGPYRYYWTQDFGTPQ